MEMKDSSHISSETPGLKEYTFCIAGFIVSLRMPASWSVARLLPSFRPFIYKGVADGTSEPVLQVACKAATEGIQAMPQDVPVVDESNDMGHLQLWPSADGYFVRQTFAPSANDSTQAEEVHTMSSNASFSRVSIALQLEAPNASLALTSLIRLAFSQAILLHGAVSIHASAVEGPDGVAYAFMGASGTGKSTHSEQWIKAYPDFRLLNDDNPVLRLTDYGITLSGTPWSGKTPCYRAVTSRVGGLVRLRQAAVNCFCLKQGVSAFMLILPGCSALRTDDVLTDALHETLAEVAERVKIGEMACRPNEEAARVCRSALLTDSEQYPQVTFNPYI